MTLAPTVHSDEPPRGHMRRTHDVDRGRRGPRLSLATKAQLIVSLIVAVLVGADGVAYVLAERAHRWDELNERAVIEASIQAQALAQPLWDYDDAQVEASLDALATDNDFRAVYVHDKEGEIIWQRVAGAVTENDLSVRRPIEIAWRDGVETLGSLDLYLSTDRVHQAVEREMRRRFFVFLTIVGSVLIAIHWCFRRVSRPLRMMAGVMGSLANGDDKVSIPGLGRKDEIGQFADAMNVFKQNAIEVVRLRTIRDRAASKERMRVRAAVEISSEAVVITDECANALYLNTAFTELLGYDLESLNAAGGYTCLFSRNNGPARMVAAVLRHGAWFGETRVRSAGGREFPATLRVSSIRTPDGQIVGYVALGADVTERQAAEARFHQLVHYDPLTGLPNRTLFRDRLEQAMTLARRDGTEVAVLLMDLHRFKDVNDVLGHAAGDQLLRDTASRICGHLRDTDTVARLAADEFAVIRKDKMGATDVDDLARILIGTTADPFRIAAQELYVGACVGAAVYPADAPRSGQLIRNADLALSQAKSQGAGTATFFKAGMDGECRARKALEFDLRRAIGGDELRLFYQPQISVATGATIGFEALVRWQHPQRGLVSPGDFIPLAEETGLIIELGAWAMRAACLQARVWQEAGMPSFRIAVNLSAVQFRGDLPSMVEATLAEAGVDPQCLELEITESVMLNDNGTNAAVLRRLHGLGVEIALDDFGTGYSSLSYLHRFPFEKIKIDRSFVGEMDVNSDAAAIVRAVIGLGHGLGMRVTAEGVENQEQLEQLRNLECDEAQGFLISRPVPAEDVSRAYLEAIFEAAV